MFVHVAAPAAVLMHLLSANASSDILTTSFQCIHSFLSKKKISPQCTHYVNLQMRPCIHSVEWLWLVGSLKL